MKKHFVLFFILFSVGALSAQNLNFKDTNGLKTLLCSKTWIRYYVNPDSSFSDRVMDSIMFYKNGTWYQSGRPKDELLQYLYYYNHERPHQGINNKRPIDNVNLLPN